jgi:hypothetical protein
MKANSALQPQSANVEYDLGNPSPFTTYVPPPQAIDLFEEIIEGCSDGRCQRSWFVLGPYGSGKSTLALVIASLFGSEASPSRRTASTAISQIDPKIVRKISQARKRLKLPKTGAFLAPVSCQQEDFATAVDRALQNGLTLRKSLPGRSPNYISRTNALLKDQDLPLEQRVLEATRSISEEVPIFLILDELGHTLEYSARTGNVDLSIAQELAEYFSNQKVPRGFLLGFQHMSFDDYSASLPPDARKGWKKVEGRFRQIVLEPSVEQAKEVIETALASSDLSREYDKNPHSQAQIIEQATGLGVPESWLGNEKHVPLHPLAVPVLARLASSYGQHGRTIIGFISSDGPACLRRLVEDRGSNGTRQAFARVGDLFEFFLRPNSLMNLAGLDLRLREIYSNVEAAGELGDLHNEVIKTIAVLNALGDSSFPASQEIIALAVTDTIVPSKDIQQTLDELQDTGLVAFREFAGEYRCWSGSDVDFSGLMSQKREQVEKTTTETDLVFEMATTYGQLRPVVARRHSFKKHLLRYLDAKYWRGSLQGLVDLETEADGLIVFCFEEGAEEAPQKTSEGKPIVLIAMGAPSELARSAMDLRATCLLTGDSSLEGDPVAIAEVNFRQTFAESNFLKRLEEFIDPSHHPLRVHALGKTFELSGRRDLETLASLVFDHTYSKTPEINSELLNRRELTSQGARARRELLAAMLEAEGKEDLEIQGSGPARTLVESALKEPGLYRNRKGEWTLGEPQRGHKARYAWIEMRKQLERAAQEPISLESLHSSLRSPPYGMREPVISVFVTSFLLALKDEVMLFEAGSFVPKLKVEHLERMTKTPQRFEVKLVVERAVSAPYFKLLSQALSGGEVETGDSEARNSILIDVIRPVYEMFRGLTPFAHNTLDISERAKEVRRRILTTSDPERLIFEALPSAVGHTSNIEGAATDVARKVVNDIISALEEITESRGRLNTHIETTLGKTFDVDAQDLRDVLSRRATGLEKTVIDPKLRSFVLLLQDQALDYEDWLAGVAMSLVDTPPDSWVDETVSEFEATSRERAKWLERLELLSASSQIARLTLTRSSGDETTAFVPTRVEEDQELASEVDAILSEIEKKFGRSGIRAALINLVERATEERDDQTTVNKKWSQ